MAKKLIELNRGFARVRIAAAIAKAMRNEKTAMVASALRTYSEGSADFADLPDRAFVLTRRLRTHNDVRP